MKCDCKNEAMQNDIIFKNGDRYYSLFIDAELSGLKIGMCAKDIYRGRITNLFRTKEEAIIALNKIKDILAEGLE